MSKMTHLDTHSQRNQLWTIIEKQRVIIQELQKALVDMTSERDSLLLKQKEEPILPPRSPYREGEKSPFIIQLLHSKWTTLPSGTETPLFILSVLDKKSGKELWRISKLYTDILALDSAVSCILYMFI
jgi:hypothetical protein